MVVILVEQVLLDGTDGGGGNCGTGGGSIGGTNPQSS